MFATLVFSVLIIALLWPFLVAAGVMDFKRSEDSLEDHLPGRPARRTIGRKNADAVKVIMGVIGCYIILCGAFYGVVNFRDLLGDTIMMMCVVGLSACALYIVTPLNRLGHAYATTGQIAVIHLCAGMSVFMIISAVFFGNFVSVEKMAAIFGLVIGAMMIFSRNQIEDTV